jgi:hypothetical protein
LLLCTFLLAMTVADLLAELLAVVVLALRALVFWCFGTRTYGHWRHWQLATGYARVHNLFHPCQLLVHLILLRFAVPSLFLRFAASVPSLC